MSKAETSLIIWAGPKSKTSIFRRDTRRRDREGEEEAVKMEAEMTAMQPPARGRLEPPGAEEVGQDSPGSLSKERSPSHTLISVFWRLTLQENRFLLF